MTPLPRPATYVSRALVALAVAFAVPTRAQVPTDYVERDASLPCLERVYGLRVHVVAPSPLDATPRRAFSPAAFDSMVAVANAAFGPICVGFEVCELLELENYRYAEDSPARRRERRALFTDPLRIDVFVSVDPGDRTTFRGIARRDTAYVDVPRARVEGTSKALARELGRYFGLYDTFEADASGPELVLGDDCETTGDLVCDTPADPFDPDDPDRDVSDYVAPDDPCRFTFRGLDARGQFYVAHTANTMSPYADECHCGLTAGQLRRVAAAIERLDGGLF